MRATDASLVGLECRERRHGRRGAQLGIQKRAGAGEANAQGALSCQVLHADEVVPRMERAGPSAVVAGLERLASVHERLAPAIG